VKEKVESAGGAILVHSEPGAFCAFQIVLPLRDEVRR
jgi:chemotaxis protein histidine kinase CheA